MIKIGFALINNFITIRFYYNNDALTRLLIIRKFGLH